MDNPYLKYEIINLIEKDIALLRLKGATKENEKEYLALFTKYFFKKLQPLISENYLNKLVSKDSDEAYNEIDNKLRDKGLRLKLITKDCLLYTRYVWQRRENMKQSSAELDLKGELIGELNEFIGIPLLDELMLINDLKSIPYDDVMYENEKNQSRLKLFVEYIISKII